MLTPAPGVLGCGQWRNQRHIVVEFVCVGYAALRQVAGASQGSKASTDIDRRQAGDEEILACIDDAGKRIATRIDKALRSVETELLPGYERLAAGLAQTDVIHHP